VLASRRVHFPGTRFDCVLDEFSKLRHNGLHKVSFDVQRVKVLLEFLVGQLVAVFELSILCAPLLHGVISEMNQPGLHVLEVVLAARGPQIAIMVEVALQISIHASNQSVGPYIEFPLLVK